LCLFFRPAEIGTIDNPLIRASLGTMTIGQDLSPLTLPLISNVINPPNQLTCSLTVENKTYIPHAIYYSSEGFDFLDNFDSNDNVYLDMAYLPECAYQYSAKMSENSTGNKLHFNVIEKEVTVGPINKIDTRPSQTFCKIVPNPSRENATLIIDSAGEDEVSVSIYAMNGNAQ